MAQSERLSAIERVMEFATPAVSTKAASSRFWYGASIAEFVGASAEKIVGQLTLNSSFDIDRSQAAAWLAEIEFLQSKLSDLAGSIFFEFNIPRMGRRIDVVLVIGPVIFAIEFKVGEKTFDRSAIDQVWDYGLDLKNFHEASHDASIIPILIATEATHVRRFELQLTLTNFIDRSLSILQAFAALLICACEDQRRVRGCRCVGARIISSDADYRRSCPFAVRAAFG